MKLGIRAKLLLVSVALSATAGACVLAASNRLFVAGLGAAIVLVVGQLMSWMTTELLTRRFGNLVNEVRATSRGDASADFEAGSRDQTMRRLVGSMAELSDELSHTVDALARERDRFQAVLENMTEAVIAVDAERRITLVNRAAIELLELHSDPVGRPVVEVLRVPGFQKALEAAERGHQASEEFEITASLTKRVLAHASPRQESVGTVVVMHDVTELRRLETMRRDFVANVSHELRTPVSIIRATAETLDEGAIDDPKHARRFLDALIRNSERLGRLISDLLDISRIEAGEYALETSPVDLQTAAARAIESVASHADERDITLELDLDDELCLVADANALDQVLLNLVGNAVKYTRGGGRVVIRARSADDQVVVEVEDDGPGIPAQQRDRIFERFYRVDFGRSREVGGTGLGLSIVKHLVTSMDGQVGYKPATPRGSIFWFVLPGC